MHKQLLFAGFLLLSAPTIAQKSTAQSPATQPLPAPSSSAVLILNTNVTGELFIDGESFGPIQANTPKKFSMEAGEHFIQVKSNGQVKNETVALEAGKKKILDRNLPSATNTTAAPVTAQASREVANLNFTLPGVTTQQAQVFYFAFEKGDEIVMNCNLVNAKGTNQILVSTFPNNAIKYSNTAFKELKDIKIRVEERSVYKFTLMTNHLLDRTCNLLINRIPQNEKTIEFNTNVRRGIKAIAKTLVEKEENFINSGSNANFKGGQSRVAIPVTLPPNTVEWYYTFSASRDEALIKKTAEQLQLGKELTTLLVKASGAGLVAGKATSIAVNNLTQPPGSDYCDIVLLDHENRGLFLAKAEYRHYPVGSRSNLKSGVVKLTDFSQGTWYLGIRNPDTWTGINTVVQVVAVVLEEEIVMEQAQ